MSLGRVLVLCLLGALLAGSSFGQKSLGFPPTIAPQGGGLYECPGTGFVVSVGFEFVGTLLTFGSPVPPTPPEMIISVYAPGSNGPVAQESFSVFADLQQSIQKVCQQAAFGHSSARADPVPALFRPRRLVKPPWTWCPAISMAMAIRMMPT